MAKLTIDAGHGGYDPGAVGPTGLQEKDVVLTLALKVGNKLTAQGVSVNYTRTDDTFVELSDRAAISNNAGDENFLSIHINSADSAAATGTETYCYSTGGNGEALATAVLNQLVPALGLYNRGVKTANFAVLRQTHAPASLVEVCFISNPNEEAFLKDDGNLDTVATAIAKGVCDYLGVSYSEATAAPAQTSTAAPSVMYRVILDGTQIEALSDYDKAVAEVKDAVDSGKNAAGKVQRNTDSVDLYTYGPLTQAADPTPTPTYAGDANIVADPTATVTQAQAWAKAKGATDTFIGIAPDYWYYAAQHGGVDPVVAYCQAAKETGFGKFGGVIDESYHNPCGMKTTAGGDNYDPNAHMHFSSWDDGVAAHLDHLALYAGAAGYPHVGSEDPRHFAYLLGVAKTVSALSGNWAPSQTYGQEILALMAELQKTAEPQQPVTTAGSTDDVEQLKKQLEAANAAATVAEAEVARLKQQLVKYDTFRDVLKEFVGGV